MTPRLHMHVLGNEAMGGRCIVFVEFKPRRQARSRAGLLRDPSWLTRGYTSSSDPPRISRCIPLTSRPRICHFTSQTNKLAASSVTAFESFPASWLNIALWPHENNAVRDTKTLSLSWITWHVRISDTGLVMGCPGERTNMLYRSCRNAANTPKKRVYPPARSQSSYMMTDEKQGNRGARVETIEQKQNEIKRA